ncbi:MAG: hypothetical protein ACI8W0_001530 [Flavobacterium sp.]|jgi:hypothetical protein
MALLHGSLFLLPEKSKNYDDIPYDSNFSFVESSEQELPNNWKLYKYSSPKPLRGEEYSGVENEIFVYSVYVGKSEDRLIILSYNNDIVINLLNLDCFKYGLSINRNSKIQIRIKKLVERLSNYPLYFKELLSKEVTLQKELSEKPDPQKASEINRVQKEINYLKGFPLRLEALTLTMLGGAFPAYGRALKTITLRGNDIFSTPIFDVLEKSGMNTYRCGIESIIDGPILTISNYGDLSFSNTSDNIIKAGNMVNLLRQWGFLVL